MPALPNPAHQRPLVRTVGLLGLTLVLGGCGSTSFGHDVTVRVVSADGSSAPAMQVSVFDPQMGFSREWATQFAGPATPSQPYHVRVQMTASQSVLNPGPPDQLDLALALPAANSVGAYRFNVAPADGVESATLGTLVAYYGQEAEAELAPKLPISVTSKRRSDGWDLDLQVPTPGPGLPGGA